MASRDPLPASAAAGLLFGFGLAMSAMTDPDVVLAFLDPFGDWDPRLASVRAGARAVPIPGYAWLRRRGRAVFGPLRWPETTRVTPSLVAGASLFGVGWGLAGYCPGPAVANLGRLAPEALWAVPAMFVGFWIADRLASRLSAAP
jgi:uncharacterized membrane protein YedE/YeeE